MEGWSFVSALVMYIIMLIAAVISFFCGAFLFVIGFLSLAFISYSAMYSAD